MRLHDAIAFALNRHGGRMNIHRLVDALNDGVYISKDDADGNRIEEYQVRARARIFNNLFDVDHNVIQLKHLTE